MRCVEKVGERSKSPSLWSEGLCSKELKKDGSQNRPLSVSKNGNPRLPLMREVSPKVTEGEKTVRKQPVVMLFACLTILSPSLRLVPHRRQPPHQRGPRRCGAFFDSLRTVHRTNVIKIRNDG